MLSLVHPDQVSYPLSLAAAIVIPLMGFWNSVIYVTTSWGAVRQLLRGELGRPDVLGGCGKWRRERMSVKEIESVEQKFGV